MQNLKRDVTLLATFLPLWCLKRNYAPPPFLNQRCYTVIISHFHLICILPAISYLSTLKNYALKYKYLKQGWSLNYFLYSIKAINSFFNSSL